MNIRPPAVAGMFYPSSRGEVLDILKNLFAYWGLKKGVGREKIPSKAIIVPHAGYEYSGYVAARVFFNIPDVKKIILIGPNHTGMGPDISVGDYDAWETPLGKVDVDKKTAAFIVNNSVAEFDEMAHLREHSIEVQLPFLQYLLDRFSIVPISLKHYYPEEEFLSLCRDLGLILAEAMDENTILVASTDFTHYQPAQVARQKDRIAMDEILKLDEGGLFGVIREYEISMCGYGGVAAALVASKIQGAKRGEEVAYMTSGDTTGDLSAVVGYGGLRVL